MGGITIEQLVHLEGDPLLGLRHLCHSAAGGHPPFRTRDFHLGSWQERHPDHFGRLGCV